MMMMMIKYRTVQRVTSRGEHPVFRKFWFQPSLAPAFPEHFFRTVRYQHGSGRNYVVPYSGGLRREVNTQCSTSLALLVTCAWPMTCKVLYGTFCRRVPTFLWRVVPRQNFGRSCRLVRLCVRTRANGLHCCCCGCLLDNYCGLIRL